MMVTGEEKLNCDTAAVEALPDRVESSESGMALSKCTLAWISHWMQATLEEGEEA